MGRFVLIKSEKRVEQRLGIERSTILDKKAKTENLFYIKSQGKVLAPRTRSTGLDFSVSILEQKDLPPYKRLRWGA